MKFHRRRKQLKSKLIPADMDGPTGVDSLPFRAEGGRIKI
jgi:hypothetical protein